MERETLNSLLNSLGWKEVYSFNNPYMYSWKHEELPRRINYYFTSGSIMLQQSPPCGPHTIVVRNATLEDVEDLLNRKR